MTQAVGRSDSIATSESRQPARVWIAWQHHRRTKEIAEHLGVELAVYTSSLPRPLKYLPLCLRTLAFLSRRRGATVFCQNPSIFLASMIVLLRPLLRLTVVVDRHTNFKLATINSRELRWRVFHTLSRFSVQKADLTIVTNDFLAKLVEDWGGQSFVMPDPIPNFDEWQEIPTGGVSRRERPVVVFVSTYSGDEPTKEVLDAVQLVGLAFDLYITSEPPDKIRKYVEGLEARERIHLTGFLPRHEYVNLLASADVVMVLTKLEHCLTCGAYEATALGRAMVLSDTDAIRSHFYKGAIYAQPHCSCIAAAIEKALECASDLSRETEALKDELIADWDNRQASLERRVEKLETKRFSRGTAQL